MTLSIEEQATGCHGSDSYKAYAEKLGYTHIEVWDWTSSAGDWQILVSKDGHEWHMLFQGNNYPRVGFSHSISPIPLYGTLVEVMKQVNAGILV